ncbi:MAG: ABC transporter ATP-binding protein ['Conium maculatum' witches'-broom phytoplasma]|nr:ABC transporter ATP-binding protein ['Conium maculatum' witches'-broom phytoplasma]
MKQLFSYLKKFKAKIYISIFLIFLVALTSAAVVIYEGKYVIDYIKSNYQNTDGTDDKVKFLKTLGIALLGNLLLYVMATIGRFIYNKLLITAIHSSVKDLREDLHKKIHRLPIKFFDQNAVGNVMSIITNDVEMVANGLQQSTISLICAFFNMILIIIVMFWANLPLGILVSLMIPSALIVIFIMNKKSRNIFIQRYEKTGEYVGFLQEKYTGHKEIALFNQQENVIQEFEEINTELTQNIFKSNFISGLVMPIVNGFTYIMVSLVVIVGIVLMRGETEVNNHFFGRMGFVAIQLGLFQGFIQYVWRLGHPINDLSQIFVVLQSTRAAGRRIFRFLGEPEEKEKPEALTLEKVEGYVDFSYVSFNYSADKPIIKNMNLKVDKNKMVAVVGPTGSGKTTLINLLVRFYDATSGSIKIDGVDIQDLKKENLRDIIGIVLQDSWLFNGTILENIRYGNLNATDEQVMEAAKQANVHDFIMAKKDGYQTVINEETANLSQGEKQLLTIARTLLRNPSILILDEATSTIDTRIEMILQESIQKLLSERTSFVIAHRLSTIVNADIIVVLENGVIIEQGTHQELLTKQGFYYNLYQSQFQKS